MPNNTFEVSISARPLILRGFYNASSLHFDASGLVREGARAGDWTVDGVVQVDDIKLSRHRLTIRANRIHFGWLKSGFGPLQDLPRPELDPAKENVQKIKYDLERVLKIEYDLDSAKEPIDVADVAFSRIFLTSNDSFFDLVPDYWKPCVHAALTQSDDKTYGGCRFSQDFLAIPGLTTVSTAGSHSAIETVQQTTPSGDYRVGNGVSPPIPLYKPDPEYTSEATRAKYQGHVLLGLIIDKDGNPTNIHIVTPLGCGLDANAVHAVERWRFKPAKKDGEPVAVTIAVEVELHLY